jgi:glycolate oxidase FAD binding subunit
VTLKVKPLAETTALVTGRVNDFGQAERLLAALVNSQTAPVAIELLAGPEWDNPVLDLGDGGSLGEDLALAVGFEGTRVEVDWQVRRLRQEWRELGIAKTAKFENSEADAIWRRLAEFPASTPSPLVLQASVRPSAVTRFVAQVRELDSAASLQAHAGNGVVLVRFAKFPPEGLSRTLIGRLQPAAAAADGHIVILSNPGGVEITHHSVWGGPAPFWLMGEVKRRFDPRGLLNPGRFVYQER